MTNEELVAIEARAEAATLGDYIFEAHARRDILALIAYIRELQTFADKSDLERFIRTDVPALIAEIRRLQAEIEELARELTLLKERVEWTG